MIRLLDLKTFADQILNEVPGFNGLIMVSDVDHAVNKIKDRPGTWLVIAYPTGSREGKLNEVKDFTSTLLYIVEKPSAGQTEEKEILQYQKLQDLALAIMKMVDEASDSGCGIFRRYSPGETTIDPEFSVFGGFNGWSMSLVF